MLKVKKGLFPLSINILYYTLILTTLFVSFSSIFIKLQKEHGWDRNIYCAASHLIEQGKDPYDISQTGPMTGNAFSFTYPVGTYPILKSICLHSDLVDFKNDWSDFYIFFYLILTILSFFLLRSLTKDSVFLLVLLFTGLNSLTANLVAGNVGIVELFFVSLSLFLLNRKQPVWSGVVIGYMASFKILSFIYLLLIILIFLIAY
ncbi:MAG: DUF2029 domain-containing protein [Deltaproteobacteria bacterium]|nr:MAG: DUF2029 domain-containing protein [Deltaproteobacteria bacterium]